MPRVCGYIGLVRYLMRIGSGYSEGAWWYSEGARNTLVHHPIEGIASRVFDDVLGRASRLPAECVYAAAAHAGLEEFLAVLVDVAPADARPLLVD